MKLPSWLKASISLLVRHPIYFCVIQFPECIFEWVEVYRPPSFETAPLKAFAILFPLYCLGSGLATAFTFLSVERLRFGKPLHFGSVLSKTLRVLPILFAGSLVLGFLGLVGFLCLILPGIYFMSTYLFVIPLILTQSRRPLLAYFGQSQRLLRGEGKTAYFKEALLLVTVFFVFGIFTYFAREYVADALGVFGFESPVAVLAIRFTLAAVHSALLYLCLSNFFFDCQSQTLEKHP